jgi:hypothetical protein
VLNVSGATKRSPKSVRRKNRKGPHEQSKKEDEAIIHQPPQVADSITISQPRAPKTGIGKISIIKGFIGALLVSNATIRSLDQVATCRLNQAYNGHVMHTEKDLMHKIDETYLVDEKWKALFPLAMQYLNGSDSWRNEQDGIRLSGRNIVVQAPSESRRGLPGGLPVGSKYRLSAEADRRLEMNQDRHCKCDVNSGALLLAHELVHANFHLNNPLGSKLLSMLSDSAFTTFEEYRTIERTNEIAAELGESSRIHHGGDFTVPSENITDFNHGECVKKYPPIYQSFEVVPTKQSDRKRLYRMFINKKFPFARVFTFFKIYKFLSMHDEFVSRISDSLLDPKLTVPKRSDLERQWSEYQNEAIQFAATFKGMLINSAMDC